jgi:hypothetical protein
MVQIFVSAGHGGIESGGFDPGSSVGGTTEAREMELTRDLIINSPDRFFMSKSRTGEGFGS